MRTLITAATILLSTSALAAESQIHRDLAYAEPADESRRLDVYAPADGKDHPVVIWLHGGGWRKGDKANVQRKPQAFVDKGFVFVSVNYRFVPQVTVKEMTGDIAKAIKWVHDNAKEYGGSPNKIFVAGHSAGAHLSALVCTDGSYLKTEGMALSAIKGCIPVDIAVYDIPRQLGGAGPLRASFFVSAFGEDETVHKQLSPITHIAKNKIIHPDSKASSFPISRSIACSQFPGPKLVQVSLTCPLCGQRLIAPPPVLKAITWVGNHFSNSGVEAL